MHQLLIIILFTVNNLYALSDADFLNQNEKDWIKENPDVRVSPDMNNFPYEFIDKEGNYSGISKDYLNLISEKTG